jgi:hypothetical protein
MQVVVKTLLNITVRQLFSHLCVLNSDAVLTVPIILKQQFKVKGNIKHSWPLKEKLAHSTVNLVTVACFNTACILSNADPSRRAV